MNNSGWCDFGINDGTPGTTYNDGTPYVSTVWLDDGEWHYYTVVFTTTTAKVYIDGVLKNGWTVDGTSDGQVISGLLEHGDALSYITLGGNQAWTWNDADPAFGFDDFAVYDAALSADQIAAIIDNKLNYDYTVNAVDGSDHVLKEIATGKVSKGSSATVYYPQYINVNGTLYSISANDSYPYYGTTFTPDADDYVKKITYTNTSTSVLYFKEGEDLFTNATNVNFASQSKMGYTSGSNSTTYVATTTLPAGTYTIHARFVNSNASAKTTNFRVGSENIVYTYAVSASSQPTVSKEFTITEAGTLYVACEGSSTTGIDWFYITGTPTYTVIGDPDYSTDYLVEMSDQVTLSPGQSWHYKLVNHNMGSTAGMAQNWVLPVYASDGTTKKIVIRADNWEDIKWANAGFGWTTSSGNWYDDFATEMNNATVDMTINYSSTNVLTMSAKITTSTDRTLTYTYNSSTAGVSLSDNIKIAISVSHSWLELMESWPTTVSKTISDAGWATYCSPYALDFSEVSGLTAYVITGYESNPVLSLDEVDDIPANTGILLKGNAGTYSIPVIATSSNTNASTGNKLVGVTSNTPIAVGAGYVLMNETAGVGFYKNTNAFTVGANTAYLPANFAGELARSFFLFGDGENTTSINEVTTTNFTNNTNEVFDLQGRRVAQPTKGLYIVNGKKVVIK